MALTSKSAKTVPAASQPTTPATAVPPDLWTAIVKASRNYDVPADLLAGIWRIESGSTYPNPAVNSSGYGGLFGTTNGLASTQDQANEAASVLANGLRASGGNVSQALSYYNSGKLVGGYTSVPGQTTFGKVQIVPKGFTREVAPGIPAGGPIGAIASPVANLLGDISSWEKDLLYGAAAAAGGLMILTGLVLIAVDLGLSARGPKPAPVQAAAIIRNRRVKVQTRRAEEAKKPIGERSRKAQRKQSFEPTDVRLERERKASEKAARKARRSQSDDIPF